MTATLEQLERQVKRLQRIVDMIVTPSVFDVKAERILLNYGRISLAANKTLTTSGDVTIGNASNATVIDEGGTLHLGGVTHDLNAAFTYTEGTWTPEYKSTSATFAYTAQTGYYIRIGLLCWISGYIQLNGTPGGTTSNTLYVTGMPFTAANIAGVQPAMNLGYYNTTDLSTGCVQLCMRVINNTKDIQYMQVFDNAAANTLTAVALGNNCVHHFSGCYQIA